MSQNNKKRRMDDELRSKLELISDLQVHKTELEAQNQELKEAQQELEIARDRHVDLYDFAPIGYLTLDKLGCVQSINLTGATLLGVHRQYIIGKPLLTCLPKVDSNAFLHYLKGIFNSSSNTVIELTITDSNQVEKHLRLVSSLISNGGSCRMVISDITQLKETAQRNQELLLENRRLLQNLYKIQEKERRVLAHELHDELGQWLSAIHAEAEIICSSLGDNSVVQESAASIKESVNEMHIVIRSMLHKLCPALLDALGLKDSLLDLRDKWCVHHANITLEFKLKGKLDDLDGHINITVYRIVQEALTNIYRHADATQASVNLHRIGDKNSETDYLLLSVQDNGKGYDTSKKPSGLGLLGMRERVIAVGGELMVRSISNDGTQIDIKLPLSAVSYNRRAEDKKQI